MAKLKRRERNGRPQREKQFSPLEIRRARDAALRGLRDPEWGTELGRLYLTGAISDQMYGAGKRWRSEAMTYRKAIGIFPVRSASLEQGIQSEPADPDSHRGQLEAAADREAMEHFFAAHAILLGCEGVVRQLVEEDRSLCGIHELNIARAGLARLAAHYRLTETGK